MAYHTKLRRAWSDWRRAVDIAQSYSLQTGWKHRVRKARHRSPMWIVERTDRPVNRTTYVFEFDAVSLHRETDGTIRGGPR